MIISALGMAICYASLLALTYLPNFCAENLWALVLPSIPIALCGNSPVFMMSSFSYLGDILQIKKAGDKEKLYRYLICEACFLSGGPIGLYMSGFLFHTYGHWLVFLISGIIELVVVMYCITRIKNDSVKLASSNTYIMLDTNKECHKETTNEFEDVFKKDNQFLECISIASYTKHFKSVFTFAKRMLRACFRQRQGRLRRILLLLLFCQALPTAVYALDGAIGYIYVKHKFDWSMKQFTEWKASYMVFVSLGTVAIAPLLSKWFSEPLQAAIACLTTGIFYFLIGVADQNVNWVMWMAMAFPILGLVPTSVARAVITRIVGADELGSVFGLISAMAGLMPMAMSSVSTRIFQYAVFHNINAGVVYFFASSLFFVAFTLSVYADFLWRAYKHLLD